MKKVYDAKAMHFITIFENIAKVTAKDCIVQDNQVIYIVKMSDVGTAVGPKGINVRQLEKNLKTKIKIVGHSDKVEEFVRAARQAERDLNRKS